ncbi:hypothetical protein A3F37_03135 [Candidatus Saccharibacteria bacterium RIFCSPHIGHO2_12_FULL_41_12]|nr:MAG: hypothetical protein A3F37_03135 [Candidatus Saccharibacteria bacterium RIFCSPHIGHO2_12_FULL_41_12]
MQNLNNKEYAKSIVKQVRRVGDGVVLWLTIALVVISLIFVMFLGKGPADLIFNACVIFGVLGFSLFAVRLYQINYLGNALRVQNGRHSFLRDIANKISRDLDMPQVDVFISQNPFLNAFAIGYIKPYTIVLHSAIVEELTQQEVTSIIAHEMGHIKLKHTWVSAYVNPLAVLVPFLGPVIGWIFGFWGRRAELAADRVAVAYTRNPHTVVSALTKVYVGSKFAEYMGEEGIAFQQKMSHGLMKLMAQSTASHPFLTTRGYEAIRFAQKLGIKV